MNKEDLINYKNNPGERMYLLLLSSDGHHKLFMNNLFYLDHEIDIEQVWYSDTDNYLQLLADEFDGACSIGIDKNFPARFLMPLMDLVDECHFELGSECVDRVRMVKDEKEQQLMIEASKINDLVVDEVINICAKGNLTEKEVSDQLAGIYQKHGCTGNSFEPIVAYGKNGADNHHSGDDSTLKPGDSIVIDIGGLYKGYCSDMTRTVFAKFVPDSVKPVYDLVLKNQLQTLKDMKEDMAIKVVSKMVENDFKINGFELVHSLGHGVGLDIHEIPFINGKNDGVLKANMTVTSEPGIYIPNRFGVRIEDTVLITKSGCINLTKSDKNYIIVDNT